MLKTTRDMIMPTAITESCPRPLWFDASLGGQSFKAALGDSLFRAVAAIINAEEAASLLNLDDMATKRVRLGDINEAFREMKADEVARTVLTFD
jgi:Zn-dependent alcohol dehydrogenase